MEGSSCVADKSLVSSTNQTVPDAGHSYQSKSETPSTQTPTVTSKPYLKAVKLRTCYITVSINCIYRIYSS